MLAYTYYTTETTRPTARLTARNYREVFTNEFILIKINYLVIDQRRDGTRYCVTRYGNTENISSALRDRNIRLFTLLDDLQIDDCVNTPELGTCDYLLFEKYQQDGSDRYKYSLTKGGANQLAALMTPVVRAPQRAVVTQGVEQEVEEPILYRADLMMHRRRQRAPRRTVVPARVEPEVDDSPEEPLVPMRAPRRVVAEQTVPARPKAKAIKFTTNTDCYICMMDFTEDPDVTMNSCCNKMAHTACYSGIIQKNKCSCCRAELE